MAEPFVINFSVFASAKDPDRLREAEALTCALRQSDLAQFGVADDAFVADAELVTATSAATS